MSYDALGCSVQNLVLLVFLCAVRLPPPGGAFEQLTTFEEEVVEVRQYFSVVCCSFVLKAFSAADRNVLADYKQANTSSY